MVWQFLSTRLDYDALQGIKLKFKITTACVFLHVYAGTIVFRNIL